MLTIVTIILISFMLALLFKDTVIGLFPYVICGASLLLYILAFFNYLSGIDLVLVAACLVLVFLLYRKYQDAKLLSEDILSIIKDPYLWICISVFALAVFLVKDKMILEWDGYSQWGPDTKSLYFRDGFAKSFSNPAQAYGNYTPLCQLSWWIGLHCVGEYKEGAIFISYYIFAASMLFSAFEALPKKFSGFKKFLVSLIAAFCSIMLPGLCDTTWYRCLTAEPIMAPMFGMLLVLILKRPSEGQKLWMCKLFVGTLALSLTKQISILWSVLVIVFFLIWTDGNKKGKWLFAGSLVLGCGAFYTSWLMYCKLISRTGYLTTSLSNVYLDRLSEIKNGIFLSAGNNLGYIKSYARAFSFSPIHREDTSFIDLTYAQLLILLLAAFILLLIFGFIPKKKWAGLLSFSLIMLLVIYAVVFIGQLTMFYEETKYLEPANAAILFGRYSSPAHLGLLMITLGLFSCEKEKGYVLEKRRFVAIVISAAIVLCTGAYSEMKRGFVFDPLDAQRIEQRNSIETEYQDFLEAIKNIPLDTEDARVLLAVYYTYVNPIIVNAASPVSLQAVALPEDLDLAISTLKSDIHSLHCGYVYVNSASEEFIKAMSSYVGFEFKINTLYKTVYLDDMNFGLTKVN